MKVIDCQQGTPEWLQARLGIATASEMDALVSPLGKVREGKGVQSYLALKLAERWRNEPLPSFGGGVVEQGSLREKDAIPWFEMETDTTVQRVGFITTDDGSVGCSPDGLLPDGTGIEVKCPQANTHVAYLLDGGLPDQYVIQVQTSIYVTGAACWRFLSYCPRMPALLLVIQPDAKIQAAIATAAESFSEAMAAGWTTLVAMNGGREPRPLGTVQERMKAAQESWNT